ncbi:mini-circle protein [Streptomyces sp. Ru73]|uniref:DinB family protein n=1 Tax=Streptomyces sp. Ru73 TaxID=2080748 RepID=UPI000CDD36E7|nr:DinB family protein [Streptomyces sp. Ru73]POX37499.1 mini-circle protein [Streptomyces sp. Ru73]
MTETSDPETPALPAPLLVRTGGEREVLDAFLDFYRSTVTGKVRGLSDADARRRLVPSETTLAGLVKHLTLVERDWFPALLADGEPPLEAGRTGGWEVGPEESLDALVAAYEAACARSREVAAGLPLEHAVPHPEIGEISLRWIYVHVIEETARHTGHLDILREQTDGATGVTA